MFSMIGSSFNCNGNMYGNRFVNNVEKKYVNKYGNKYDNIYGTKYDSMCGYKYDYKFACRIFLYERLEMV